MIEFKEHRGEHTEAQRLKIGADRQDTMDWRQLAQSTEASFWAARINQLLMERWTIDDRVVAESHALAPAAAMTTSALNGARRFSISFSTSPRRFAGCLRQTVD